MSPSTNSNPQPERITRVVDFRIPLPWLLSGAIVVMWGLISMYFALQQLTRDVADLQITIKAGNSMSSAFTGEMALLKFRVENLESAQRTGKGDK